MGESSAAPWKEIATSFLKVGATAYGGPAIMGGMQAEFQETMTRPARAAPLAYFLYLGSRGFGSIIVVIRQGAIL